MLRHAIPFVIVSLCSGIETARGEEISQWTVTMHEGVATLEIDPSAPLSCLTATIDAVTKLGFDGVTVSQIESSAQKVADRGVVFTARAVNGTVTLRSPRPVPMDTLIVFLQTLRKVAAIERVAFESGPTKATLLKDRPLDTRRTRDESTVPEPSEQPHEP